MTALPACAIRQADFRGWRGYFLENGLIRLVAVPELGGRVMACDLGPYPYLFVDPDLAGQLFTPEEHQGDGSLAAWKNYGGDKTWPSPQGWDTDAEWHGPPDPVLDSGRYTVTTFEATDAQAVIAMTSPPDPRTGVQITRRFTLQRGSSRVALDITFRNTLERPIRWSIWDVAQLRADRRLPDGTRAHDPACVVSTPVNPASRFPRGFSVMFGAEDNPQWQVDAAAGLFIAPYQWVIGKVGLDSPAGWVAFSNPTEGYAFAERFAFEPKGEYPDNGATVEVWTVGAGRVGNLNYADSGIYLMETELLSPFRSIAPGQTAGFAIEWGACRADGPVVDVSAAGCLTAPLRVEPQAEGYTRLTARGGVFAPGALALTWMDGAGQVLKRETLGTVHPLHLLALDCVTRPPDGARRVELRLAADSDLSETALTWKDLP